MDGTHAHGAVLTTVSAEHSIRLAYHGKCTNGTSRPNLRAAASLAAALGVSACAGQGVTQTGFLPAYDQMRPTADHERDKIWVSPAFTPAAYSRVIIEPVAWVPAPDTPARDPETIAKLSSDFRDALSAAFADRYQIVDAPGPATLRVRAAVTNTARANWWVNVPAQAAQIALGGIGLLRPSSGGASEEIEVADSQTGQGLVRIATYNNGMPWNVLGSYVQFNHARRAFRIAAELTREQVDRGAKPTPPVAVGSAPVHVASGAGQP